MMNRTILSQIILITCLITFINLSSVRVNSKYNNQKYTQYQSTSTIDSSSSNEFQLQSSLIYQHQNTNSHTLLPIQNDYSLIQNRLLQSCTDTNCFFCPDPNICEQCSQTYYIVLNVGTCSLCSDHFTAQDHCKQCSQISESTFKCDQCQDSLYFLDPVTQTCKNCNQQLPLCFACTYANEFVCTQCQASYYVKTLNNVKSCQLCSLAINNCNTCESNTICSQCVSTHQLDAGDASCFKCLDQHPGCSICQPPITANSPKLCKQCLSGYILQTDKTCISCNIQNCKTCIQQNNAGFCSECIDITYYYNTGSSKCEKCNTLTAPLYGGHCVQCMLNTNGVPKCQVCQSGYVIEGNTNLGCQVCSPQLVSSVCTQCTTNSNSVTLCSLCENNYYIKDNGANCQSCDKDIILPLGTCIQCVADGTFNLCTKCTTNYVPSSDRKICQTCSQNMANCENCNNDNTNLVNTCTQCTNNKFVNVQQIGCDDCSNVIPACTSCQNVVGVTKCKLCDDSITPKKYVDNLDRLNCKICSQVITQCQTCKNDNGVVGVTTCIACTTNYYVSNYDNKQCKSCVQAFIGCLRCSNNNGVTDCLECNAPNYVSLDKTQCKLCGDIFPSCTQCSNNEGVTKCTKCSSDLLVKVDGSGCIPCSPTVDSCSKCSGTDIVPVCTACSGGLVPNFQKNACSTCNALIKYCSSCAVDANGATTCSACSNNLLPELDKRTCSICPRIISNCQTCSTTNTGTTTCTTCVSTSYPKSPTACLSCTSFSSKCIQCTPATVIVNSVSRVVGKCQVCQNENIPTDDYYQCKTCGYFISNCIQCNYIKTPRANRCTLCRTINVVVNQVQVQVQLYPRVAPTSDSCLTCIQAIPLCKTCILESGITKCSECMSSSFIPNAQKTVCIVKT